MFSTYYENCINFENNIGFYTRYYTTVISYINYTICMFINIYIYVSKSLTYINKIKKILIRSYLNCTKYV